MIAPGSKDPKHSVSLWGMCLFVTVVVGSVAVILGGRFEREVFNGLVEMIRSKMGVSHRGVYVTVAKKLLDGW